jgi:hypothetical protein
LPALASTVAFMSSSLDFTEVRKDVEWPKTFSVCCLVSDWLAYKKARTAYSERGFSSDLCEFLVADNTQGNEFSAFEAVRCFMREARGRYVIVAHQDAWPLEAAEKLLGRISEVERHDPAWGVIGNAGVGGEAGSGSARSIELPDERHELGRPFVRVRTIDENVMIIRHGTGITASADLDGYHLYAFDICSIARRLGFSCYVVDHMWRHESHGSIDAGFLDARDRMEHKLREADHAGTEQTMCTVVAGGGGARPLTAAIQALWMLGDDQQRRSAGYRLLMERSSRRWPLFPLAYHPLTIIHRLQRRMVRGLDGPVARHLRGAVKVAGWHLRWWRNNWRSRFGGERPSGNE